MLPHSRRSFERWVTPSVKKRLHTDQKDSLPDRPIEGLESRVADAVSRAREHKAIGFFHVASFSSWDLLGQCDWDVFFQRGLSMVRVDGLFGQRYLQSAEFWSSNFAAEVFGLSWRRGSV